MLRGRLYDGGLTTLLARLQAAVADDYSVACEIGRGGMATVYLGDDLKLERQVAIKLLHPQLATGLGVERFLREIKTAAGLTHPHIVPLFDSGDCRGKAACRLTTRSASHAKSWRRSGTPTRTAWCTATSSPKTSSSRPAAR